jgi:NitT/TauT family transport system ATP-binding protein
MLPSASGPFRVLEDISLGIKPGEFLCIVGPSGCGKTSLLRILGGLIAPTFGSVCLAGEPLTSPRRDIGFVFQRANLMPWRTVLHNVTLPLEVAGIDHSEARKRATELLELVGLSGQERTYPRQLSGGMQQRVIIARALIHNPLVLLMDEPFGALDALTRERLNLELLQIWRARQKTIVLVTHNIQEAVLLGDRVFVMNSNPGRVVDEVEVALPRPRDLDIQWQDSFGHLVDRIRDSIGCDESFCPTT